MKYSFIFLTFLLIPVLGHGQSKQTTLDSIEAVFTTTKDDSIRAEAYYQYAKAVQGEDINAAIEYSSKSAELGLEIGASRIAAGAYNFLGIVYFGLGDYEKTLNYFYDVLNIYEQIQDSVQIAKIYNNVGLILIDLGRVEESIEYYEKSLKIKRNRGDKLGVANTLSNLGLVQSDLGNYDIAHDYFMQSLRVDQNLGQTIGTFKDLSNLADNYLNRNMYDSAEYYYSRAMSMMDDIDEQYNKSELVRRIGRLNFLNGEYERALEKYQMALGMAEEINAKTLLGKNYLGLSEVYKQLGDFKMALEYYEKYTAINEQQFSEEQAQKLAQIENNYQIKQRENKIQLLNKESEIKDLKLSNTQMVIYWLAGIVLLISVIIILQIRKNNYKTKANNLLRVQNEEIVEKNRNIMDSILCAKNIQQAILPEDEKLNSVFKEAFVMARARDVVSGDFYWFAEKGDKVLIAAVDCTGHGVPAAFLNVMGNSLLNQIVYEANVLNPGEVLTELNKRVLRSLKSNKLYTQVDDGMDIGICMMDRNTKKLTFAGAKRPMYFFHGSELNVVKGDHYPVGGVLFEAERHYQEHELALQPNDLVYLFTDGLVDQFGGSENKKFMYFRFKKLLKDVCEKPLNEQKRIIESELVKWQGENEQTDDMLLIGVRV
ncbi:tetratricopeptide repeat protein [Fulvivirga lutea]|uniref:Tetratricopeptide repeat protein n=1 Tax=Fulvivirga lutea TaxID=2810512 RepID=A0A974WL80_9BACT|nr:tetratricopeptide repeat protein [Fulvivirga lutea]QSE98255.1 tetratricopeptide repeat protein [Fulvivirga lutea]